MSATITVLLYNDRILNVAIISELGHVDVVAGEAATEGAIVAPAVRVRQVTTVLFLMIKIAFTSSCMAT